MINFLKDVIQFKWMIAVFTLFCGIAGVVWAFYTPDEYRAKVMLLPVSEDNRGMIGGMSGQIGGLASLAGFNIGNGSSDNIVLAKELINDWSFVDDFIKKNDLKVYLFAVSGWDKKTQQLNYDESLYNSKTHQWVTENGVSKEPSDWLIFTEFKKRAMLREQKGSPLIIASFEYYSPKLSKIWLEKLIQAINAKIQTDDINQSKNNIEYLNLQIENTNISEMKSVFYQLLQEQMKKLMLAEVRKEYILKQVGPIKQPESKFKPYRMLMIVLSTMMGFLLSLVLISLRPVIADLQRHSVL